MERCEQRFKPLWKCVYWKPIFSIVDLLIFNWNNATLLLHSDVEVSHHLFSGCCVGTSVVTMDHLEKKWIGLFSVFPVIQQQFIFTFTFKQQFNIWKIPWSCYFSHFFSHLYCLTRYHFCETPLVPYQLCRATHSRIPSARKRHFSIQGRGSLENQAHVSEMVWWKTEGNLTCLPRHGVCSLKLSEG